MGLSSENSYPQIHWLIIILPATIVILRGIPHFQTHPDNPRYILQAEELLLRRDYEEVGSTFLTVFNRWTRDSIGQQGFCSVACEDRDSAHHIRLCAGPERSEHAGWHLRIAFHYGCSMESECRMPQRCESVRDRPVHKWHPLTSVDWGGGRGEDGLAHELLQESFYPSDCCIQLLWRFWGIPRRFLGNGIRPMSCEI